MSVTLEPNPCLRKSNKRGEVTLASHNVIGHWLGQPCIHIEGGRYLRKKNYYPVVYERNINPILIHESIHCALTELFNGSELNDLNDSFDDLLRLLPISRKILEV